MRINTLTFATQILNSNPKKLAGLVGGHPKECKGVIVLLRRTITPELLKKLVGL
jgi:hypothetical protein